MKIKKIEKSFIDYKDGRKEPSFKSGEYEAPQGHTDTLFMDKINEIIDALADSQIDTKSEVCIHSEKDGYKSSQDKECEDNPNLIHVKKEFWEKIMSPEIKCLSRSSINKYHMSDCPNGSQDKEPTEWEENIKHQIGCLLAEHGSDNDNSRIANVLELISQTLRDQAEDLEIAHQEDLEIACREERKRLIGEIEKEMIVDYVDPDNKVRKGWYEAMDHALELLTKLKEDK